MNDKPNPGLEPGPDGNLVGRDPRKMSREELEQVGPRPRSLLSAKRAKCLDCCGDQPGEVRKCVATSCANWFYRMGKDPFRASPTDVQRAASRRNASRLNAKPKKHVKSTELPSEETPIVGLPAASNGKD
jgi:hypothetical protein